MKQFAALVLAGAALSIVSIPAVAQDKPTAEVMHWWTSGGEAAAIKEFAKAYDAAGGVWKDTATALGENSRAAAINRMVGGNPPAAAQFNTGKQFDDLVAQGLVRSIDDLSKEEGWQAVMPPFLYDAASRDGKLYALPINVHGQNWMFYSKKVLSDSGVESLPTGWDALVPALEKIRAAGFIPLAQGGQPWQERLLFSAILLGKGGKDLYFKIYRDHDAEAAQSDEFRGVVEAFGALRGFVDQGSPGRNWNDATALVLQDKAGMQLMGDWAVGEFRTAGKVADKDYGCSIGLKGDTLIVGGDVFVFPKTGDEAQVKAQNLLAKTMLDPATQVKFNLAKGSMPIRNDVDTGEFNACAQKGMALLKDKDSQVPVVDIIMSASLLGALDDVLTQYWHNPSASADDVVEGFVSAFELEE
ncbi:ABC transporter substrate-binding protein [Consotaella salsifontis]|uniref:Probable sugar-binding periplasmic protein n=1 Tax=Consotaella salsifontis TaxID=1365950 RepID=A0A1T4MPU5_9HYPH|nr:ABC transporter substrate-binding protein [Consotaella salsifontis]SJZ68784.1 carbohydrate ABC transporter substrate-binding protein, CUT1 family [Consotaella salsifontis]